MNFESSDGGEGQDAARIAERLGMEHATNDCIVDGLASDVRMGTFPPHWNPEGSAA